MDEIITDVAVEMVPPPTVVYRIRILSKTGRSEIRE